MRKEEIDLLLKAREFKGYRGMHFVKSMIDNGMASRQEFIPWDEWFKSDMGKAAIKEMENAEKIRLG